MGNEEDSRNNGEIDHGSRNTNESDRYPVGYTYRWECPICHSEGVTSVRNPAQVLRTHVYESTRDGHGDFGVFPEEFPEDANVDEFITRIDEGE